MKQDEERDKGFGRYRLFSLFGFEVNLDLSWLLLALLISWSLGAGVFPATYPDLAKQTYAWMGVACAVGVFFSIVIHEFSHSFVARQFGMQIKGITLFIFGGVAEMEKEPSDPKSEFLIAIAGPAASFLLAFVLYRVEGIAIAYEWPVPVIGVSSTLAYINMVVAVFNLIPAFPLDGGRIFRAVLWHWKGDIRLATSISSRMGRAFGVALMLLGGFALIQGDLIGGMWWFLIGMFLRGAATASNRQQLVREVLEGRPVRDFMSRDPVSVPPSTTVQEWIDDYVYRHHFKLFPVVENSTLLGSVSVNCIRQIGRRDRETKTVGELMEPVSSRNAVSADTETTSLLSTLVRPDKPSRFMVVDQDRLVGMISIKDLMELIALKLEIEPR